MKKKIFSVMFLMMLTLLCGLFVGCGDKYAKLNLSVGFSFDGYQEDTGASIGSNGKRYVKTDGSVAFDYYANTNTYIFYIKNNDTTNADFEVEFKDAPKDFNYRANFNFSNTEIAKVLDNGKQVDNTYVKSVNFFGVGSTVLTAYSYEGEKKANVNIQVVEIADKIEFKVDNLAIVNVQGSTLCLDRSKVLNITPSDSSYVGIDYQFGYYTESGNPETFKEYKTVYDGVSGSEYLWDKGLSWDKKTSTLTVSGEVNIDSFFVKATYNNPIGDDLVAETEVKIVKKVENFQIIKSPYKSDTSEYPKVSGLDEVQTLILNITDMNFIDVVLKVKDNGENVTFDYVDDPLLPVYFLKPYAIQKDSGYSYYFFKVVASKKTTQNSKYGLDGLYNLNFVCNYSDYTVDGYPLQSGFKLKCDALVKNFSVNGVALDSYKVKTDDINNSKCFVSNVYINAEEGTKGTKFVIDVANPHEILEENAKFKVALYDNSLTAVTNVAEKFEVFREVNGNLINADLGQTFDKGTTFYFKAKSELNIGDVYYLVVTAVEPSADDKEGKRANASIKMNIVEGISEISNFDSLTKNYLVDDDTGRYVKIDYSGDKTVYFGDVGGENKYYVLGEDGKSETELTEGKDKDFTVLKFDEESGKYYKLIDETKADEKNNRQECSGVYVLVESSKTGNTFNATTFVSNDLVKIDLFCGREANIVLNYLETNANVDNVVISSSNESIFKVEKNSCKKEKDGKYGFSITPISIGQAEILVTISNLNNVYKIKVGVYEPITNLTVGLRSTNLSSGVGDYLFNANGSVEEVTVTYNKVVYLNVDTTPRDASEYTLTYDLYHYESGARGDNLGSYTKGSTDSSSLKDGGDFFFNCQNNSFIFYNDIATTKKYEIVIKLTNNDGSYFERSVILSSYIPVESLSVDATKSLLYSPNTISYDMKQEEDNPTNIAFKVEVNKYSKYKSTFDFEKNGTLKVGFNGREERFVLGEGILEFKGKTAEDDNQILSPISLSCDEDGYYWFKLNEDYSYLADYGKIYVIFEIEELPEARQGSHIFSRTTSFYVKDAVLSSTLDSNSIDELYFEQGLTSGQTINVQLGSEDTYNKNLYYKVLDEVVVGDNIYYVERQEDGIIEKISLTKLGSDSGVYEFEVSSKNAGNSVVILLPEDKVITQAQKNKWNNYTFVSCDVTEQEFLGNTFYTYNGFGYDLADSFEVGKSYFIKSVNIDSFSEFWSVYSKALKKNLNNYLIFYISVADGIKVPYQISSLDGLNKIGLNGDSVTKRYVLANNITIPNSYNFEPIGNYFEVKLTSATYEKNRYFVFDGAKYTISSVDFNSDTIYFDFGFGGELRGAKTVRNIVLGEVTTYYTIGNINYSGKFEKQYYGLFGKTGNNAHIYDLTLTFSNFEIESSVKDFCFGGVSGENYGKIENVSINFKNTSIKLENDASFGGVAGVNYGKISESNSKFYLTGNLTINVAENLNTNIGGFVGVNNGEVCGNYNESGEIKPVFNDAGFDSSLNLKVDLISGRITSSSVGGVVGSNFGKVQNFAIQGKIDAGKFDNVGGLVGIANYSEIYDTESDYSIEKSYSTAKIVGYDNVGGAIGQVKCDSGDKNVKIYNISAENYAGIYNTSRTFVSGNANVGGLIGLAKYCDINYSYAVSYFDEIEFDETKVVDSTNFDVVGSSSVGGFVGNIQNSTINNSSSFVYVFGEDIFAGSVSSVTVTNIFARGFVKENLTSPKINIASENGYYNYNYWTGTDTQTKEDDVSSLTDADVWAVNAQINNGLPYLVLNGNPLYATTPININLIVKNNDDKHIKYQDDSMILFYNIDTYNKYETFADKIEELNTISIMNIANLSVFPSTYKSNRLDVTVENIDSNVLMVLSNGDLKICKEGSAIVTVSSKLNSKYNAKIYVVVKCGLTNVVVYDSIAQVTNLKNENIVTLKKKSNLLSVEKDYIREIKIGLNKTETMELDLTNTEDVGIRFKIEKEDADTICSDLGVSSLNNILKINGLNWIMESDCYYVDTPTSMAPIIESFLATNGNELTIYYTPYLRESFNYVSRVVLLEKFGGSFTFEVKKGATKIDLDSNVNSVVELNQLQTLTFDVTLYTDYEIDDLVVTAYEVEYDTYSNGIALGSGKIDFIDDYNPTDLDKEINLSDDSTLIKFVRSSVVTRRYDDKGILESVTYTYTINYKDKLNAIEKDKVYKFVFGSTSNPNVKKAVGVVLVEQKTINHVRGTVYSYLADFPQKEDNARYIYNGEVGVLALEVYPYLSDYSTIKIHYSTTVNNPMFITQLSYNINGEVGKKLSDYIYSGAISDSSENLWLEKSSAQDTYLANNYGVYSYSKIYFLSMIVATEVPDNTVYTIYADFYDRNNNLVATRSFEILTIAKPTVRLNFDKKLLDSEGDAYYLPLNTSNILDVTRVNYDGEIEWEISCTDEDSTFSLNEATKQVLTPVLNGNGQYVFKVLDYENGNFDANLLGHTIRITANIEDNRIKDSISIDVVVTLFTVTDINVYDLENDYLTLSLSTVEKLEVEVGAYYDESVESVENNWYKDLTEKWKTGIKTDIVYSYLTKCGYTEENNFIDYFGQLSEAIAKATYSCNYSTSTPRKSGVWYYKGNGKDPSYLEINKSYNNMAFGVEAYGDYFGINGYQIDKVSALSLKVLLSYTNCSKDGTGGKDVNGIPNVLNYNIDSMDEKNAYEGKFNFEKDFNLNFTYNSDLINAIPVATAEDFLNMEEGKDYRLVSDIELSDYIPISTEISSFDGNGYTIYITSFSYDSSFTGDCVLGLFEEVSKNTILYNVNVYYTNKIEKIVQNNITGSSRIIEKMTSSQIGIEIELSDCSSLNFGGIAVTNNGALTNCKVSGDISINISNGIDSYFGGLVKTNSDSGCITNSSVKNFDISCNGKIGGVIYENKGKIVSTYFSNSSINNSSEKTSAGFVHNNSGLISECFAEGYRLKSDTLQNKGVGINSTGSISGFVYSNSGEINDCYSNIMLRSSGDYIAGFVFNEDSNSIISRCYSMCFKPQESVSKVASIFLGRTDPEKTDVKGKLNNCYYLIDNNSNWNEVLWGSSDPTKMAIGLKDFSSHTNFQNFDLSLGYSTGLYADNTTYNYAEGYTWVIIGGKPVLTSTLIETISKRDYKGKQKSYGGSFVYEDKDIVTVEKITGTNKVNYYADDGGSELVYYTELADNLLTFYFTVPEGKPYGDLDVGYEKLTLVYDNAGKKFVKAFYGEEKNNKVLDFNVTIDDKILEDSNFSANDTLFIEYDSNFGSDDQYIINKITYKILKNVSYYYEDASIGYSERVGSRTNSQIIYDEESFVYYLKEKKSAGQYYRIIKDIDFTKFTETAYSTFAGVLQGNYMDLNNIAISYLNKNNETGNDSFGLFSNISTINNSINDFNSTMIYNLNINIKEVISNSHPYVGVLAGKILTTGKKVILNNINIFSVSKNRAFVQGLNVVGGLVGSATGDVILKDISCGVCVNATKEMSIGDVDLYYKDKNISSISYAGGIIGIFDTNTVKDPYSRKDYNAESLSVAGDISVIGSIVGSAFGLVGTKTKVKYINTLVGNSNTCFLKSIAYSGGLVGENRGKIYSSSVKYSSADTTDVGASSFAENDYFYNNNSLDSCIAIGGLVGLNNGGCVYNCLTNINVRNSYAYSAGGAIGRMVEGTLENVIASGAVTAEKNMGGLIGLLNDERMFGNDHFYYDKTDIKKENNLYFQANICGNGDKTEIKNCVACNNWLTQDTDFYKWKLSSNKAVSGFIGLISYSTNEYEFYGFASFKDCYYSNTVSSGSQSQVSLYLIPAYKSNGDSRTADESSIISAIYDSFDETEQEVWPFSTEKFYYEEPETGISYLITSKKHNKTDTSENPTVDFVYEIESSKVDNIKDFYTEIDLTMTYTEGGTDYVWGDVYEGGMTLKENKLTSSWLNNRFGQVYKYDENSEDFIKVENDTNPITLSNPKNSGYYIVGTMKLEEGVAMVSAPYLESITSTRSMTVGSNCSVSTKENGVASKYNEYTFNKPEEGIDIDDVIKSINAITVNGVEFKGVVEENWCSELETTTFASNNGKDLIVSYDDCNLFGMVANKFGDINGLQQHTAKTASTEIVKTVNALGTKFSEYLGEISSLDKKNQFYKDFYSQAIGLYNKSYASFAHVTYNLDNYVNSAIINIADGSTSTFKTEYSDINFAQLIANLYGFNDVDNFKSFATTIVNYYKDYDTNISSMPALANGCFRTDKGFVFPIVVKNNFDSPVLTYVIVNTNVYVWINDIENVLWATNFDENHKSTYTINNKLYCKNILFINGAKSYPNYKFNLNEKIELPNGVKITGVNFSVEQKEVKQITGEKITVYAISSVDFTYEYTIAKTYDKNNLSTKSDNVFVYNFKSNSLDGTTYNVCVSSKEVIYKSFNNGYWGIPDNLYYSKVEYNLSKETAGFYSLVDKFPETKREIEIYKWTDFKASDYKNISANEIEISTPEQLALLAENVNQGTNYSSYTIKLTADIDLSGKYWVPIGTESNPFSGIFDGEGYSIKYAIVNSVANGGDNFEYAGIFGVVSGAQIKNLITIGGEIEGLTAGGIVGKAVGNLTVENVNNNNNVSGVSCAGGIVGQGTTINCNGDIVDKAEIDIKQTNSGNTLLYAGGIFGKVETLSVSVASTLINNGEVSLINSQTSYVSKKYISVYVGGICGNISSSLTNSGKVNNYGNLSVSTNAHNMYVGGVFGYLKIEDSIQNLKNYGDIDLTYSNTCSTQKVNEKEYFDANKVGIGGVVGFIETTEDEKIISLLGNEGEIDLVVNSATITNIGYGGVIGQLRSSFKVTIDQCYNVNNLTLNTVNNKTTVGLGGILGFSDLTDGEKIISNCYNTSKIQSDSNANNFVGGILGCGFVLVDNGYTNINGETSSYKTYLVVQNNSESITGLIQTISNCLNIGMVVVPNYNETQNSLGAIMGLVLATYDGTEIKNKNANFANNFYLRGTCYNGSIYLTGASILNVGLSEIKTTILQDETGKIEEHIKSKLKNFETGEGKQYFGWNSEIWGQVYETWYPTLIKNTISSNWSDKQEKVYQSNGTYLVKSAEELSYLATQINDGMIDSSSITIKLVSSIDLANRYWTPIGTKQNPFKGVFDGNGYSVENMTIKDVDYAGLFGYVLNATIKDVGLISPIIERAKEAGALACQVTNSRIEKCYTSCEGSSASIVSASDCVGGIVGTMIDCGPMDKNNNLGGLYYSYNNLSVKLNSNITEDSCVGGLVGQMKRSLINSVYNNTEGSVDLVTGYSGTVVASMYICNNVDGECSLINVFNLNDKSSEYVRLFNIEEGKVEILTDVTPTFENLSGTEATKKLIWTNEYSFDGSSYPSLRGLGKYWKNTESEDVKYDIYKDKSINEIESKLIIKLSSISEETLVKVITQPKSPDSDKETEKKCFVISNEEDLVWLANNVNSGLLDTQKCEFVLTNDIDLAGKYWTPIGNSVYEFKGIFNFNGHTISNMTIDSSELYYAGLFGCTNNAYIANGYIVNSFIKVTNNNATLPTYVGTVVGKGYNTSIENMLVKTSISVNAEHNIFLGGIVGHLHGVSYTLSNLCVYGGKSIDLGEENKNRVVDSGITTSNKKILEDNISIGAFSQNGDVYAGGAVGYMSGYTVSNRETEYLLKNASNSANIAAVSSNECLVYLGGILGYGIDEVNISIVNNSGYLKSYTTKTDYLGGIAGYLSDSNIKNAMFTGYLECSHESTKTVSDVGGIVGEMLYNGTIAFCVNQGEIYNNTTASNTIIGAIIGRSVNHLFNSDGYCIYMENYTTFGEDVDTGNEGNNVQGFTYYQGGGVGIVEYSKSIKQELVNKGSYVNDVKYDKFANNTDNYSDFSEDYWQTGVALSNAHIFIVGCQVSFKFVVATNGLSDEGVLKVDLTSEISVNSGSLVDGDEIKIAIVDKDFNYHVLTIVVPENFDSIKEEERELFKTINGLIDYYNSDKVDVTDKIDCNDQLIVCYITLIKVAEPTI